MHTHSIVFQTHVKVNIELVVCQVKSTSRTVVVVKENSSASSCAGVHGQLGRPNAWPALCSSGQLNLFIAGVAGVDQILAWMKPIPFVESSGNGTKQRVIPWWLCNPYGRLPWWLMSAS